MHFAHGINTLLGALLRSVVRQKHTDARTRTISLLAFISVVAWSFVLFASLSYSADAYGPAERGRQDMTRRASVALEEILGTEEFKAQRTQSTWWSGLLERFLDRLLGETKWAGAVLEWVFYLVIVIAAAFVFIFMAKRLRRSPSSSTQPDGVLIEPQGRMGPAAFRMQAYEYAQRRDYRQAIRHLYLSFLLHLDEVGLFNYDAGKTNGEYLGEIHGSMVDEAQRFAYLTSLFERKWYGMEESCERDFQRYAKVYESIDL
jgi:hypothetical protein